MKTFLFWVKEKFSITINGYPEEINILAGSNISKQQACETAALKAKTIESRIEKREAKEDYEVTIKEHVLDVIDASNIITVCRYGAKILNTTEYTILDLDDYPIDFFDRFKGLGKLTKKERIVFKFQEKLKRYPILGSDFRIYETAKGIRVIGKKYIAPSDEKYTTLMSRLSVDWLYLAMSKRQQCYRARITPKPYRMRIKTIKIKSPLDCEGPAYNDWSTYYTEASKQFTVVKLIKSLGKDFGHDHVIKLHDHISRADENKKLA